ncbi:MAG: NAD-dependent epimerase/dehydratase family protein [Candidatus Micrarchaeia archaeon]
MAKKILLTGGSGFIGRNIVELLGASCEISRPARAELDLLDSDAVGRFLKGGEFDVVVHCVGIGSTRRSKSDGLFEKNFRMFMNVAHCSGSFGKMIQLGSGAEYDKSRPLVRLREEMPGFQFTPLDKGMPGLYSWYAANKGKIEYGKIAADRY